MKTIPVMVVFLLIMVACSAPRTAPDKSERQVFNLGTYMVKAPSPKGWLVEVPPAKWEAKVEEINGHKSIIFMKIFYTALGEFKHSDMISIIENVTMGEAWAHPIEKIADMVRDQELEIMHTEGVSKKIYALENVQKSEMKMAGMDLYCLSYVKWMGGKWGAGTESGRMALYFPEAYDKNHIFYIFMISNMNKGGGGRFYVDEDAFREVVESFRLTQ